MVLPGNAGTQPGPGVRQRPASLRTEYALPGVAAKYASQADTW